MKKILVYLAVICGIAACETDGNNASRFDDVIASFDMAQMDQDQFVAALTTEMLCYNGVDIYTEREGWGTEVLGLVYGWNGILCSPDGTSKYVAKYPPIAPEILSGVICTNGRWSYDQKMGEFTIDTRSDKLVARVVYFKYPRLILEGVRSGYRRYVFRWDCFFSKEDPQALLDSCTHFVDANEK